MKKILFVLHYPPPVHGASMMGAYVKNSKTINSAFKCRYINLGTSVKVDEIGSGGLGKLYRFLRIWFSVLRHLIGFRPNLVYFTLTATGGGFFKDTAIVLLSKVLGVKVVYHLHNKGVSSSRDKWYYDICYRFVFRQAHVILLSQHLYSDIESYVSIDKVHICPNGVPEIPSSDSKGAFESDTVNLLFLSNLIESKGVFDLVEACRLLKARNLNFHCTIIGGEADISESRLLYEIKRLDVQSHVNYLGKRYGEEKAAAYEKADIFIFPTYYPNECFPLVLLEAMQYALPIISTREGGIQDIVEDNGTGFLVIGKDTESLAEKIESLIKNGKLRYDFGIEAKKRYEENFTLATFERNFTHILKIINEESAVH